MEHKKLITKVTSIREKQKYSKTSEFNIKLFAFIAIMLAINAIAIVLPLPFVRNLLIYIALLWIVIALIYFVFSLIQIRYLKTKQLLKSIQTTITSKKEIDRYAVDSTEHRSLLFSSSQTWKRSATWFLIIAGGLAFNGISFLQPASPKIMSRIYMVTAVLWLIATFVILYYVMRYEEVQKGKTHGSQSAG